MIDSSKIRNITEEKLQGTDLFLVEVKVSAGNEIEVVVDSDTHVDIDACAELSRKLEEVLDRETEDFQLTVGSAGIGQPLRLLRQYVKLIGKPVDILLKSGSKFTAILESTDENKIGVSYEDKVTIEGKKRKQTVTVRKEVPFAEIKAVTEHLAFK